MDGIAIVDYKTSKTISSAKSNLQLAIYSMYLEQTKEKDISGLPHHASLHFLREYDKPLKVIHLKRRTFGYSKKNKSSCKWYSTKKSFDPKKGRHCDWCDYKFFACHAWED